MHLYLYKFYIKLLQIVLLVVDILVMFHLSNMINMWRRTQNSTLIYYTSTFL